MEQALAATVMAKAVTGAAAAGRRRGSDAAAAAATHGTRARVVGGSRRSTPRRTLKRQQRRQEQQEQQPRRASSTATVVNASANSFARASGQPTDVLGMETGVDYQDEQELQLDTPRAFDGSPSQGRNRRGKFSNQQAKNRGRTNAKSRSRGALKQPQRRSQNH